MKEIPGVVVAEVVQNDNDPRGEGRIQVSFPALPAMHEYPWAPIAVPLAGAQRGMYFMPEQGDEVLVAFEHGDFDHPFVVGFLWNGAARPPDEDVTASVRRLRTVSGHVLEFDDRAGQERIFLKTQGGHQIEMKDMPQPSQIRITTSGGNRIEIVDPSSITISTPTGILTLEAPRIVMNGEVQVATITAQPGPGVGGPPMDRAQLRLPATGNVEIEPASGGGLIVNGPISYRSPSAGGALVSLP